MKNEPVLFTRNGKLVGKLVPVKVDKKTAFKRLEELKNGLHDVEENEKIIGRMEKYNEGHIFSV